MLSVIQSTHIAGCLPRLWCCVMREVSMATGKVKWFSDAKGYGFIETTEDSTAGRDIFVHYSEIANGGYRTPVPGQGVRFELADGPKGLQAKNVEVVIELN